jgi:cytochrome c553
MRRVLKWIAISLGSVVAAVVGILLGLFLLGRMKAGEIPQYTVQPPLIPSDRVSIARGRHLAEAVALCTECHQNGLRGRNLGLPPLVARLVATNLTAGEGGIGGRYTAADWDRAIRHGVARDGRKLVMMPSEYYAEMTDSDFAALVAFLNTLTPVDNELPPSRIGILGSALIGSGRFPFPADILNHAEVGQNSVARGVTPEYGSYLVTLGNCRGCHGPELRGTTRRIGPPPAPNLIDSTRNWSADDFRKAIRSGRTPAGRALDPQKMPWPRLANLTDDELDAVFEYVRSIATR